MLVGESGRPKRLFSSVIADVICIFGIIQEFSDWLVYDAITQRKKCRMTAFYGKYFQQRDIIKQFELEVLWKIELMILKT